MGSGTRRGVISSLLDLIGQTLPVVASVGIVVVHRVTVATGSNVLFCLFLDLEALQDTLFQGAKPPYALGYIFPEHTVYCNRTH